MAISVYGGKNKCLKKCPKKIPNVRTILGLFGQNVQSKFQSSWNPANFFFKINIFKKFFKEHCQSVKQFGSFVGPDLSPNCLQRSSADDKSRC